MTPNFDFGTYAARSRSWGSGRTCKVGGTLTGIHRSKSETVRPPAAALELPVIFHAADASSLDGQRRFLRATKIRLVMMVVAAGAGGLSWAVGGADYAGILAAVGFFAALAAELFILQTQPERVWYEGRAAAESAKTLAWRYAVGGEPFSRAAITAEQADRLLVERLSDVLRDLDGLDLSTTLGTGQQITDQMRALREDTLDARKAAYEANRIADQQAWYAGKAKLNALLGRRWAAVLVAIEALGGITALVKAANVGLPIRAAGILGLLAAAGTALAAWVQTRRHQALACSYSVAATELASVRALVQWQQTEESWAAFVRDAERALSREHSLWRSSRRVQAGVIE